MDNLVSTYQHIADILSFEFSNSKLEKKLSDPSFDWDSVVKEGSKHFVIPAIYCRLQSKALLHLLPKELISYLEYITNENSNRNEAILNQILSIAQLLIENNIEYVFLKGSALLALGCFNDNAERMLGDIDILVVANQLDKTFQLLTNNGYEPMEQTLGNDFFEHKHLPRLKTTQHISAVEIHRKLFVSYKYQPLSSKTIFEEKRLHNNIYIPSQKHLLMHNILNFQVNDKGDLYNSISFRSGYDTLILQQTYNDNTEWHKNKKIKKYFKYTGLFFKDIKVATSVKPNLFTSFYLFKLKHIKFYRNWNKLLNLSNFTRILLKRFWLFISNSAYRKAIIKDRKRVFSYFKSILNNF